MATRSLGALTIDLIAKTLGFEQGMDAASRKFSKSLSDMERQADEFAGSIKSTISNALAAVGVGLSLDAFIGEIKSTIDYMDQMGKAAQKVGNISVEQFSSLNYAASLANVGTQDLTDAMGKLIKNLALAKNPLSEQGKLFAALKLPKSDLQDATQFIKDFSDRFNELGGDATAVQAGMALFGKGFQDLIPLLSEGSQGISDAQSEAKDLGVVLSKDDSDAANQFNDDITKLKASTQGWFIQISQALLPVLDTWAEDAVDLAKDHEDLGEKTQALVHVLEALAGIGDLVAGGFKVIEASVETVSIAIGNFFKQWGEVEDIMSHPFSADAWKKGLTDIVADSNAARDQIRDTWANATKGITADMDAAAKNIGRIAGTVVDLPGLQTKKAADSIIDNIMGSPDKNKKDADSIRNSLNSVFADPGNTRAKASQDALASFQQYVSGLTDSSLFVQGDKALTSYVQDMAKLEDAFDKAIAKGADAGAATAAYWQGAEANLRKYQKALDEQTAAVKDYKDALNDQLNAQKAVIDVQLKSMTMGDQEAQFYKQLADDTADATKQLGDLQKQFAHGTISAQVYQEENTALKAALDQRHQYIMDEQARELALQGDFTAGMQKGIKDFIEQQNNLFSQGQQFIQNFASGFSDAFAEWASGAESAKKAFGDFIDSLFADALRFVANQAIAKMFAALGGAGNNSGSQNVFSYGVFGSNGNGLSGSDSSSGWGGILSWIGSLFGGGRASGGSVMPSMFYRVNENGPELLSVGNQDYLMMGKSGGYVHPVQSHGGGVTINQVVNVQPTSTRQTADQVANVTARKLRIAQARNG